jgi:hypothetical protein
MKASVSFTRIALERMKRVEMRTKRKLSTKKSDLNDKHREVERSKKSN